MFVALQFSLCKASGKIKLADQFSFSPLLSKKQMTLRLYFQGVTKSKKIEQIDYEIMKGGA